MRSITSITVESESFHAINSEEEEAEKIYIVTFLHFLKHNLKKMLYSYTKRHRKNYKSHLTRSGTQIDSFGKWQMKNMKF